MTQLRDVTLTRRRAALALTALAALPLAACGVTEQADFEDGPDSPAAEVPEESDAEQPSPSDGGGEEQQTGADDASGGAPEVIDPADAVDTISYTLPTDELDGTMTVGLHHLIQRGRTMELLLTYTPEFRESGTFSLWELHGDNHSNVPPALFDRDNLKRYDILGTGSAWDTPNVWNSKQAEHKLASGDTQAYWATFAAPEDDIDTINIAIPGAPEFEDVPIEQGVAADDATAEGGE